MRSLKVILILFVFYVDSAVAFGEGEDGVCRTTVWNRGRGRGKMTDKPTYRLVCCEGRKYDADTKKCVFHCRFGCERGKCVGPNTCSCDPPLTLINNKCVEPICDSPCVNGKCVETNTCLCNKGFEKVNTTHCAPKCPLGYEHPCVNGSCMVSGGDLGYIDPYICVPKCAEECINGDCVAPDVCRCREGYKNETRWLCTPVCEDCKNGTCVAPNECQCFEGFLKKDGRTCTPNCVQPCTNGVCTEPNVCTCDKGYMMEYKVTYDNVTEEKCMPVCFKMCINGYCESPESCACDAGFKRNDTQPSICYKPCEGPCENGMCTLHGICHCDQGFTNENGTCIAIPPVDCETCGGNCTEGGCWCTDDRPCFIPTQVESAEVASSARLAGLELTWVVGGAVGFLLLTLVIVVIGHLWRKRKEYGAKAPDDKGNTYGSVAYTVPDTLMRTGKNVIQENEYDVVNEQDSNEAAGETLLETTGAHEDKIYD